jgi:hypothetical protein
MYIDFLCGIPFIKALDLIPVVVMSSLRNETEQVIKSGKSNFVHGILEATFQSASSDDLLHIAFT